MKTKFTFQCLATAVAIASTLTLSTVAQARPQVGGGTNPPVANPRPRPNPVAAATVFRCVSYGSGFATIAQRGTRTSEPMITWESYVFGAEYTPEQRCQTVSQKLTRAVSQNGGSLKNLLLTTGNLNGQTVICYINMGAANCNSSNMLFTLNPENARDPGAALATVLRFGSGAGLGPLRQSAGGEDASPTVDLDAVVEQALAVGTHQSAGSEEGNDPGSNTQTNPVTAPSEPSNPQSGGDGGGW